MIELKSPISKKPLGPSRMNEAFPDNFNWIISGTSRAITCQICGKQYPKLHPDARCHYYADFLGLQAVMDCCGAIFDELYEKHGKFLAGLLLERFAKNPYLPEFYDFLEELRAVGEQSQKKADEMHASVSKTLENFNAQIAKI